MLEEVWKFLESQRPEAEESEEENTSSTFRERVFYLAAAAVDFVGLLLQYLEPCKMPECGFGYWYRYLTIWGLTTQFLYLVFGFIATFELGHGRLKIARDRFFTLCFPITCLISVLFWSVIFPFQAQLRRGKLLVLSILQHGVTAVIIWTDIIMIKHRYGVWLLEVGILLLYGSLYLIWAFICHSKDHVWAYSFQSLSVGAAIGFYISMFVFAIILYFLGRILCWKIHWRSEGINRYSSISGSQEFT